MRFLVVEGNAAVDQADTNGATPLMMAALFGRAATSELLAALGAGLAVRCQEAPAEDLARISE